MKNLIFSCAIASALAISCSSESGNSYSIVGSVVNGELEGSTIYLCEVGSRVKVDSTVVADGKFEMEGVTSNPNIFNIVAGREKAVVTTGDSATVTIGDEITVEQGVEAATIAEMSASIDKIYGAFREFAKANSDDRDAQRAEYDKVKKAMSEIQGGYLVANPDNLVGAYAVTLQVNDMGSLEQLDSLIALAPLSANIYSVVKNRQSKIQAIKTAVGEPFVDFAGASLEGAPVKLSDYVGKGSYVLVDFWASWCGPCRAEMPNLRAVYEKHKDNGLILLGVNVWDNKKACLQAVEHEEMTWPIIYASEDTTATDSYGILGIPTIILFAPDGTIVDRTARGQKIMELIDSVYAK